MKKIIFITLFFLGTTSFAQGNLQFNQVKLVSTVETVPTGKVWKVEAFHYQGGAPFCVGGVAPFTTCGSSSGSHGPGIWAIMAYAINGAANYVISLGPTGSISNIQNVPFWLSAGSTLAAGTNMRYLSVIEFNIIP
ncbi:MAG: hypothetical protein RIT10_154 [Bacteroidota bacterium]|jgi:hypothetical protein